MGYPQTLTEALDARKDQDRSITYIRGAREESTVSFSDLHSRALGVLRYFQNAGVKRGDHLVLFTNSNEQFIDAFWACLFGGIVPVPVAVGISDDHRFKLLRIFRKLSSPYIYTELTLIHRLRDFGKHHDLSEEIKALEDRAFVVDDFTDVSRPGEVITVAPDDVAFIQFSSGSTSEPKGVVLTHKNVLTNIRAINEAGRYTDRDISLSWMPLTHDMGLIGFHLCMIVAGVNQHFIDTSLFVRRALLWLQKATDKKATLLCSPNFGYKHFLKAYEAKRDSSLDLSAVRIVFNGAEPISVDLCDSFVAAMSAHGLKKTAMFPVYGLAEATVGVSFPALGSEYRAVTMDRHSLRVGQRFESLAEDDPSAIRFMVVGKPLRDCQVRIVDDEHLVLEESRIGHIEIRGDNVTSGYYRARELNEQAFASGDGWLDTGDLGCFLDDELVITGRSKDIIFVNGQNYYPHDLEEVVHSETGLDLGKVVVVGARTKHSDSDHITVFVRHRGELADFATTAARVRTAINEQTGLDVHDVIPIERVPKTTSGKIQRAQLVEAYANGEFDRVIQSLETLHDEAASGARPTTELERVIKNIFDMVIVDKAVHIDDNFFEIGIGSLALAQIHERLDEIYPGKIDIADLFDHQTIRALAAHVESKLEFA